MENLFLRRVFRYLNKYFMVPVFRLGLGQFMGNPLAGYIMVLKTKGRKSGIVRYSPVNYALIGGNIYCIAGWGQVSDWYRNMRARPDIEVILPGGAIAGIAEEVTEPDEVLAASRQILKNAGFAGYLLGFNPHSVSDEVIKEKLAGIPLIRIRPRGIGNGAADPGGWLWVLGFVAMALVLFRPRCRR